MKQNNGEPIIFCEWSAVNSIKMKRRDFTFSNLLETENYYENKLRYYNGQLLTTKGNQEYHGFGLKSIKSSVEKYNGSLTINTENNWFTILILIPSVK
jgi:hypothetical protein